MVAFIDDHRDVYGVEPICRQLPIAASTYYEHKAGLACPKRLSDRARRDAGLKPRIRAIWEDNFRVYGARKIWHQLRREGVEVARCTVERLMHEMGIEGVRRGAHRRTTRPAPITVCPDDRVRRRFSAERPNQLWVADFTYVPTWVGFVYTAFVIDVFAKRIVGWRTDRSMATSLVLDALEQALHARRDCDGLIHHSDRGVQYLSIRYTQRLTDAGIDGSVGSIGNSYDNALAETIIGLYKTEVIHHQGPWRKAGDVEYATLIWVDWFNYRRLLGSIGHVPPAELEAAYDRQTKGQAIAA
jgi:transposase InsO family protein